MIARRRWFNARREPRSSAWSRVSPGVRRPLALGVAVFIAVFAIGLGWGLVARGHARVPQIVVLGGGDRLAVLVLAGEARVLIAGGNDATAIGNALAGALPPALNRLDVLLVPTGSPSDRLAADAVHRAVEVRQTLSLAALTGNAAADPPGAATVLAAPRRLTLPGGVAIDVEVASVAADVPDAWRAVIRSGSSTVVVIPDGGAANLFAPVPAVAAVIVTGTAPAAAVAAMRPGALIVGSTVATSTKLQSELSASETEDLWIARVFPGTSVQLRFVAGGVRLPDDAIQVAAESSSSAKD